MTGLLGVIGDPVDHSLSPIIHNQWLQMAGIDAAYEAIQVAPGDLPGALNTLRDTAAIGVNVTLPHKRAALNAAKTASEAATKIGAANTLTLNKDGEWSANNTDAPGFLSALKRAGVADLEAQNILILGAGGAARALTYALHAEGVALTILNRTVAHAAKLSADLTGGKAVYGPMGQLTDKLSNTEIVINTASLGYGGDHFDLAPSNGKLFFDISYGKAAAPQLTHAEAQGWRTVDGLEMLVAQAAESFHIWFGLWPDVDVALKKCRAIVEAAP